MSSVEVDRKCEGVFFKELVLMMDTGDRTDKGESISNP